jgi:hypothetical protein
MNDNSVKENVAVKHLRIRHRNWGVIESIAKRKIEETYRNHSRYLYRKFVTFWYDIVDYMYN